ncbi:MAG TPA: fibronectin type III domain-containing protein [Planctomycetota bacterium]|nr:fibronectin type III domain-containing protein [Planctomycetota bacterium]
MKLSDRIKFVTNQPERIIFGVCTIILLIVLAGYLAGDKENETVVTVMKAKGQLDEVIKMNVPAVLGPIGYLKKIKGIWEEIQRPLEGKSWLMYRPPIIPVKFVKIAIIPQDKKTNLSPIAKGVITDTNKPDEITLTWDGNISSTAQIKSYKIYRRAQGEKEFTEIIEIPAVTSTESGYIHIDKGVRPETEYSYCFTALSDESNAIKKESDRSGELKATTPRDYTVEFMSVDEGNNRVWTKIGKYLNEKWDKKEGFIVKGEKIEKDKFITGWTLLDFQKDVYERKMGDGRVIKKPTFRIIYLDKGKEFSVLIEPK